MTKVDHGRMANAIRALAMDAVEKAKSGHPGLPMGAADIATVLFTKFLKFDAADPRWPDRDRFILSAGHGSMLLYALLYLTGNEDVTLDQIKRFRQLDSKTPGHPENFITAGVETTTGPLGQGVASSVGTALAERLLAAEFGDDIVDHYTYVLCSDGDLMEGVSHEAIALAGHLKLSKLIFLYDDNGISIDGPLSLSDSVDQVARFKAHGWNAVQIDGHDQHAIEAAIEQAQSSDRPSLIACKTTIGFGAPTKAGTAKAHGEALGADELAGAKKALGWDYGPFEIPDDVLQAWRNVGKQGASAHAEWNSRFDALPADNPRRIPAPGDRPQAPGRARRGDRQAEGQARRRAAEHRHPQGQRIGARGAGAVDAGIAARLRRSDAVQQHPHQGKEVTPGDFSGRYIHYGIREMGMAAAMNGISTHGGFAPAGGTFLCFTDYARPSMRIAALSHTPVTYIMTHDSIGLGEDGPTHQPVEHLAALRAMPNMRVFRPADAVETAECWQLALENTKGPTVLALSRQNLSPVRKQASADNRCAQGGYELIAAEGRARVALFASGSEVEIAVAAHKQLVERGIADAGGLGALARAAAGAAG